MPDTESQSSCFFISFFGTVLKLPHHTCTEVLLPNSSSLKSSVFSGTSQKKALSAVQGLQGGLNAFLGCSLEGLTVLRIVIVRAGSETSWHFATARWLASRCIPEDLFYSWWCSWGRCLLYSDTPKGQFWLKQLVPPGPSHHVLQCGNWALRRV